MNTKTHNWHAAANELFCEGKAIINGQLVSAKSDKTFAKHSPIDGRHLGDVAECGSEDVDDAVAGGRAVFERGTWRNMPPRERAQRILKLADLMEERAAEFALLETLDMGKPISDSLHEDVPESIACLRFYAQAIDKVNGEITPTGPEAMSLVLHEPLGVVGAVVPWNFPLMMAVWKVAPALATGNSVILKPAEQSPYTAILLGKLALEAGIPEGVLNVVPGDGPSAGQAIGRHYDVDMVTFTGSTEIGKLFLRYSGESNMKRVSLECGGKSPNIVFADAPDLEATAAAIAGGIFANQGEICSAGSRLLVEASVHAELLDLILAEAKSWQPGDPLDPNTKMGAMVDARQHERVLSYIDGGVSEGAKLKAGGKAARTESGGVYIEPTVFDSVKPEMAIAKEEIFGPVLGVTKFKSFDESISNANNTNYGLAAAVWTKDINRAMRAAKQVRAGSVWVNCYDGGDITTPFGGFKQSGFGRDKSIHAMQKYTDMKSVWIEIGS